MFTNIRFDEKTPKYIWISEEAVQQGGPLTVNISCIVLADPVAKLTWFYANNGQRVVPGNRQPGPGLQVNIADNADNLSVLRLDFKSMEEIKNPRHNSRTKYLCKAINNQGEASHQFEIKVGRIPDSPQIVAIDYKDGEWRMCSRKILVF